MKGALRTVVIVATILVASPAWGEAPPGDPPPDPWARYHQAFDALARGDLDAARATLRAIVDARTGHPAEQRAREILVALDRAPIVEPEPDVVDVRAPERPTKLARAELAFWQTIMGITVGVQVCLVIECDSATGTVGTIALGSGLGLGISLYATRNGITSGERAIWNSASSWGYWNGIALALITDAETNFGLDSNELGLIMLGGQATGYAVGLLIATQLEPTGGQVALANTVGIWAGALTLFAMGAFEIDSENAAYLKGALVASDLGLLGGALLARAFPMSRGRTLLIDAGGILGMLAGFGTAVLIGGDDLSQNAGFGAALAGTSLGLAGAVIFTRDWDAPRLPARVTLTPLPHGGAAIGVAFDL